jgi:peptidoglycan-N-acetylglucosamine deacetylase
VSSSILWTFDDGPSQYTEPILDLLDAHGVKGTFFIVGQKVEARPAAVRSIIARGHRVGNHSYSHPSLPQLTAADVHDELVACTTAISGAGVPAPTLFRPPYGDTNDTVRRVAAELDLEQMLSDIDPQDWRSDSAQIINAVTAEARGGGVLLLHDGGGDRSETVAALGTLLERFADA